MANKLSKHFGPNLITAIINAFRAELNELRVAQAKTEISKKDFNAKIKNKLDELPQDDWEKDDQD